MNRARPRSSRLWQILLSHFRQMKGGLLLSAACMLGLSATEVLAPWPVKIIFDHVLLQKPLSARLAFLGGLHQAGRVGFLVAVSLTIFLIALLRGSFSYCQFYMTSRIGSQAVYILRRELFAHIQRLSLGFHARAASGELLTKVATDTDTLRDVFTNWGLTFAGQLLTLLGMFVVMFVLNWKLALIVLIPTPLLAVGTVLFVTRVRRVYRRYWGEWAGITGFLAATISGIRVVKGLGAGDSLSARGKGGSPRGSARC